MSTSRRPSLWVPSLSMLCVSLISYIDRNTLALLAPTILADCHLSGEQYGYIISAFSIAYMAGNPFWGRLLDRYGTRKGMTAAVSLWTAASAAHAGLSGFWGFASARAVLGFGEGATFPGGLRTVVETLPANLRSRGVAIAYSGGSLGAILTPLIVTPIYQWFGWRGAFLFTGVIGVLWLVFWRAVSRSFGKPRVTEAPPPIRYADPRAWSFVLSYAMGGIPLAFVLYQGSLYFTRVFGLSQVDIGKLLWIPPLGWEAGYFLWGWLADRYRSRYADPITIYRRLTFLALVLIVPLAWGAQIRSLPILMALLFLAMFVAGGNVITSVGYATQVFGSSRAGLIAGLGAGSWSAFVALTMPWFGRMLDQRRFDAAFLVATLIPVIGFLFWLIVNRRRAGVPEFGSAHQSLPQE